MRSCSNKSAFAPFLDYIAGALRALPAVTGPESGPGALPRASVREKSECAALSHKTPCRGICDLTGCSFTTGGTP